MYTLQITRKRIVVTMHQMGKNEFESQIFAHESSRCELGNIFACNNPKSKFKKAELMEKPVHA